MHRLFRLPERSSFQGAMNGKWTRWGLLVRGSESFGLVESNPDASEEENVLWARSGLREEAKRIVSRGNTTEINDTRGERGGSECDVLHLRGAMVNLDNVKRAVVVYPDYNGEISRKKIILHHVMAMYSDSHVDP